MSTMPPAAEAMYFDGAPVAHIVQHQERQRLQRAERQGREVLHLRLGGRR